jgi:phenylacetate-CoA ligase
MNPFYNPVFLSKILKSYVLDIDRLSNFNERTLKKYQDVCLRKIVRFAYSVPLYHDKYKKANVHPDDIRGIADITKLPIISKYDMKAFYPDGIIPSGAKKEHFIEISTSGTTGKSLSLYGDMYDAVLWLFWYIRVLRNHGINWRKERLSIIGDFAPHTIGSGYIKRGVLSNLNSSGFFKNMQWLNTNDDPFEVMKEVNKFKPDFLGGYVGMLGHLALLKEKGYGTDVNPRSIATIGSILTPPLRNLLEKTFHARVFEVYGATESGTIAFQCHQGRYHIMSDLVYPEFLKDGAAVSSKEPGKLVITKLYGRGTPIIRYDAVNDIVAPLYETCDCGLVGGLIQKIYGRDDLCLYFSGGRVLLPASQAEIYGKVLYELKSNKIRETRIIQHSLLKLEIQLMFDKKLRDERPSNDEIFSIIKKGYEEKIGADVDIDIKEEETIIHKNQPRIISKVDRTNFRIKKYI